MSQSDFQCRVCLEPDEKENLITPCLCDGSMKYIHLECLNDWIRQCNSKRCQTCRKKYQAPEGSLVKLRPLFFPHPVVFERNSLWDIYCVFLKAVAFLPIISKFIDLSKVLIGLDNDHFDPEKSLEAVFQHLPLALGMAIEMTVFANQRFSMIFWFHPGVFTLAVLLVTVPVNLAVFWYYEVAIPFW